ncbi:MAG: FkbM family methyltransferase [Myxococcota bacterium]
MYTRLLLARAITRRLREVPGAVLAMEPFRRWNAGVPGTMLVNDFDGDLKFELELSGTMGSQIFWYGSYSRHVLRVLDAIVHPGNTVVDVGANAGEVALYCAKRVGPGGFVAAFEPMSALYRRLRSNLDLNGFGRVQTYEMALGATSGEVDLYTAEGSYHDGTWHEGLATTKPSDARATPAQTSVPRRTLDEIRPSLRPIDVLKIDVEGAELEVIEGARETLATDLPYVVVEVQREQAAAGGHEQATILDVLSELGYRFFRIDRARPLRSIDRHNLRKFQNVLAVPPDRATV